jgi:hypothetical protein
VSSGSSHRMGQSSLVSWRHKGMERTLCTGVMGEYNDSQEHRDKSPSTSSSGSRYGGAITLAGESNVSHLSMRAEIQLEL